MFFLTVFSIFSLFTKIINNHFGNILMGANVSYLKYLYVS